MNIKNLLLSLITLTLCAAAQAQNYVLVDLPPSAGSAAANSIRDGQIGGSLLNHATLWGTDGSVADLHPSFLDSPTTLGRSSILGQSAGFQVGSGSGTSTLGRPIALLWTGSANSATPLPTTAETYSSQAVAIGDGQIVGTLQTFSTRRESVVFGPPHAALWDASTGSLTDLYPGGNGTYALGVGGGKQVGYDIKGELNAVMWSGSAKSMVSLHPLRGFDASVASATDGATQVGYGGVDVQIFVEKRGRRVRFNYPLVWTGTAASAQMLSLGGYRDGYATAVKGTEICGYGSVGIPAGPITAYHAIAWTGTNHTFVDLHAFVPAGYTSSRASGVDAQGNISGTITTSAGASHAVIWVPVAP